MIPCGYCTSNYGPTLLPLAISNHTGNPKLSITDSNRWQPLDICQHCQRLACPDCSLTQDSTRPVRDLPEYLSVQVSWPREFIYPPDQASLLATIDDPSVLQLLLFKTSVGFGWHFYPPGIETASVMVSIETRPGFSCEDCLGIDPEPAEQRASNFKPVRLCPDEEAGEDFSMYSLQLRPKALSLVYADGKYQPPDWSDFKYYKTAISRGWNNKKTGLRTRVFEDGRMTIGGPVPPGNWWPSSIKPDALDHITYGQEVDDLVHEAILQWLDLYADRHTDWCARNPGKPYSPYFQSRTAWTCLQLAARTLHPPQEETTTIEETDDLPFQDPSLLQIIDREDSRLQVYLDHTIEEVITQKPATTVIDREGNKIVLNGSSITKAKRINHVDPESFVCQTGSISPESFLIQEEDAQDQLINLLNTSYEDDARESLLELRSICDTTPRIKDFIPKQTYPEWEALLKAWPKTKKKSTPSERTLYVRARNEALKRGKLNLTDDLPFQAAA